MEQNRRRRPRAKDDGTGNLAVRCGVQLHVLRLGSVCLLIAAWLQAGIIAPLPVSTLAEAPFVAVCRVESVHPGAFVPARQGGQFGARHTVAALRLLRAMPEMRALHISLNYYSSNGAMRNGHPEYPSLGPGETYVFALIPDGSQWRLLADEGWGLVVPAIDAAPAGGAPASKRAFIMREILNSLLRGSYADLYRFSTYMQFRHAAELDDEIMAGLTAALPRGDPRWLDISTALLGNVGIPRQKLDDFISAGPTVPLAPASLAARTLRELPESERREGILRNMLRYTPIHEWGSAVTLVPEFKDDPLLLELLPGYLHQHQKGAFLTASTLVNNGQTALLDLTLESALRVLTDKNVDYNELSAACRLLLDHGSDPQFEEYLKVLRESKVRDVRRYSQLWQVAWEGKSPRVVRILAVVLDDERVESQDGAVRYCDFAAGVLQRFSGQDFGVTQWDQMPLPQRNAAVARARAWMKQTGNGAR